ncbi:MAG TPA: hypothetical protein VNO35_18780 [Steroidobacteraceae bacterium]|nr:hypothetical protein [Steroidobacteraceae bacterium]
MTRDIFERLTSNAWPQLFRQPVRQAPRTLDPGGWEWSNIRDACLPVLLLVGLLRR